MMLSKKNFAQTLPMVCLFCLPSLDAMNDVPTRHTSNEEPALFKAIKKNDLDVFRAALLVAGVDVNALWRGYAALHLAAYFGRADIVRELLFSGANPNFKDQLEQTPLILACMMRHADVVAVLLHQRVYGGTAMAVDIKLQDYEGYTALHWAALKGHERIVKMLLGADEASALIKIIDKMDFAALDVAIENNHQEIVSLLQAFDDDTGMFVRDEFNGIFLFKLRA